LYLILELSDRKVLQLSDTEVLDDVGLTNERFSSGEDFFEEILEIVTSFEMQSSCFSAQLSGSGLESGFVLELVL